MAQHAVEVERVALVGDVGTTGEYDLHAIAGADVFLRLQDSGFEVGLVDVGLAGRELGDGGELGGDGGTGTSDDRTEGFEFLLRGLPGGISVGRRFHAGVDDEAEGLAGVVKGDDAVDQHEVEQGGASRVLGRLRDGGLDAVDVFVADHADHAADERREAGDLGDAQAGEFLLYQRQRVSRRGDGLLGAVAAGDLRAVFPGGEGHRRGGAAEAVASELIAARDGFEKEG